MAIRKIKPGIYNVGVIDWDRETFDELIPLPEGTSYNAYLVQGETKTALVDTADPEGKEEFFRNLEELGVSRIDYLVSNHTEQDHSGLIPDVLERYPEALVLTNKKCKELLQVHLVLPEEKFQVVENGEKVELGGKTLQFFLTPWVHWPETQITFLPEEGILFPCDFLGSHLASNEAFSKNDGRVFRAAKRYFAEIMMPFANHVKKHLELLKTLEIRMVCPSHGPAFDDPSFILSAYDDWVNGPVRNKVLIPYVSMHGSVQKMAQHLLNAFSREGIEAHLMNMAKTDTGDFAIELVDAATVLMGVSAMLSAPHPLMLQTALLVNAFRPKTRFVGLFHSYGWGSRTVEIMQQTLKAVKAEWLEPVVVRGIPREEDLLRLDALVKTVCAHHAQLQ
ncbi:MAG TPA: FprA family A-type flavoprotein [Thermotogota bacterium]|nr:FprA family A-type flavoprotein [Thermotogota bacterium]